MKRKHWDFLHKLSNYYAREYDLVAVEDLYAKGLMELPLNSCNRAGAAWETFLRMLEYKCEREGTHFVVVDSGATTNEYAGGIEPASRCGSANTPVPRAGSPPTGTGTGPTTSWYAD